VAEAEACFRLRGGGPGAHSLCQPGDLMGANDVGTPRYRKNPENNEVLIVDSKKVQASGWKSKEKIAKFIRKEIERKIA